MFVVGKLCVLTLSIKKFIHKLSGSLVFKTNGALDAHFSCAMIQLVVLTIDKV